MWLYKFILNHKNTCLYGIFLCIVSFNLFHHELWRDEVRNWQLAAGSSSITELIKNMTYDGHTIVYNFMVYVWYSIFNNVLSVKFLQWIGIALVGFFIFIKFKITTPAKVLLLFNYYLIYEYGSISRCYIWSILFVVIYVYLYHNGYKNYILKFILLALAANTTYFGIVMAGMCLLLEFTEYLKNKNHQFWVFSFLVLVSFYLAWLQIKPETDSLFYQDLETNWFVKQKWDWALGKSVLSILYIPKFSIQYIWNSHVLSEHVTLSFWIFIAFMITFLILWRRQLWILIITCVGFLGVLFFLYKSQWMYSRYSGFTFISLLITFFIYYQKFNTAQKWFFYIIFMVQAISGLIFTFWDYQYKFSESQFVTKWIKQHQLSHLPIIGSPDFSLENISAHLNKPYFALESNEMRYYADWSNRKQFKFPITNFQNGLNQAFMQNDSCLVFYPKNIESMPNIKTINLPKYKLLGSFLSQSERYEGYFVYLFEKK